MQPWHGTDLLRGRRDEEQTLLDSCDVGLGHEAKGRLDLERGTQWEPILRLCIALSDILSEAFFEKE